jgi:hypothetical protein
MNTQTLKSVHVPELIFIQVTEMTEGVLKWGRMKHQCFRLITDFQGPITDNDEIYSADGKWCYRTPCKEDKEIIPKAAYRLHEGLEKAGFKVSQVLIGHEVKTTPEVPIEIPIPPPLIYSPQVQTVTTKTSEIDWGNVAQGAAKVMLVGVVGIAMISIFTLVGALRVIDPSYCIVLDDEMGTVVEILTWNTEA